MLLYSGRKIKLSVSSRLKSVLSQLFLPDSLRQRIGVYLPVDERYGFVQVIVTFIGSSDFVAVTLCPYPIAEPTDSILSKFEYVTFSARESVSSSKLSFSFSRGNTV